MWDKLETIVRRYESLEQELAVPRGDYQGYAALGREEAELEPLGNRQRRLLASCVARTHLG